MGASSRPSHPGFPFSIQAHNRTDIKGFANAKFQLPIIAAVAWLASSQSAVESAHRRLQAGLYAKAAVNFVDF
jgi:hypothetical protein